LPNVLTSTGTDDYLTSAKTKLESTDFVTYLYTNATSLSGLKLNSSTFSALEVTSALAKPSISKDPDTTDTSSITLTFNITGTDGFVFAGISKSTSNATAPTAY